MLLTLMSLNGMFGPGPTPPSVLGQGGGGYTAGTYFDDEYGEKKERDRKKRIMEEDDEIINILKLWVNQTNNN